MTDPTFVLIPGAGGASWYWHPVTDELRRRGREVVAVDLPADDDSAALPEYTALVTEAARGRTGVVLVGQSLGAFTAVMACGRLDAALLVLVNPMIPLPGETPGAWWENTGQAGAMRANDRREGRPADAEFDVFTYFLHDVPRRLVEEAASEERPESDAVFASPLDLAAWPDVPTRVLVGRDDRLFPVGFQRRVARERLGLVPDEIPGGHLVALSQPLLVADRLEAYWAEVAPAQGGTGRRGRPDS
ncbi:alpha/beta fold hydrolase [Kitasatospora sp. NPDC127111]|uniref:alpha/beta fold hydrolase n=1 Tax=Kitasatospora sp. NPDC127111 TaxID=3345363 RepID=UPI00363C83D7